MIPEPGFPRLPPAEAPPPRSVEELEAHLEQACRAWTAAGFTLGAFQRDSSCGCIVEAAAWFRTGDRARWSSWRPLGIPTVSGFVSLYFGFDGSGPPPKMEREYYDMGVRFRERVRAGEYR